MELNNTTGYRTERVVLQNKDGRDLLVVIVKATYSVTHKQRLIPAEEQTPIQFADEHYGNAEQSSIRYESDLAPYKANTDVVLLGHAYAAKGWSKWVDVSLSAGVSNCTVRVFGDRHWEKGFMAERISDPKPFERTPLLYENAFGGKDLTPADVSDQESDPRNPIGIGFRARKSKRAIEGDPLPNLEDPTALIKSLDDRPTPVGFGFIGRHWQPRLAYAGTMDQNWIDRRLPLLPEDFDERYFNGAHPALVCNGWLGGNEVIQVANADPSGLLRFSLPGECPYARVETRSGESAPAMRLDTLVIEPDKEKLTVVWRGSMDAHHILHQIKRITVGLDRLH